MKYEYWIFKPGSTEELGALIPSNEPISHMQVGHSFHLEYRDGDITTDFDLVIKRIAVSLVVAPDRFLHPTLVATPVPQKMEVRIYTRKWEQQDPH